jgi:hypothetical protein
MSDSPTPQIQTWHIDSFVFCARSPDKNYGPVGRVCESIGMFGFKIRDNWLRLLPHKRNLTETYAD